METTQRTVRYWEPPTQSMLRPARRDQGQAARTNPPGLATRSAHHPGGLQIRQRTNPDCCRGRYLLQPGGLQENRRGRAYPACRVRAAGPPQAERPRIGPPLKQPDRGAVMEQQGYSTRESNEPSASATASNKHPRNGPLRAVPHRRTSHPSRSLARPRPFYALA